MSALMKSFMTPSFVADVLTPRDRQGRGSEKAQQLVLFS